VASQRQFVVARDRICGTWLPPELFHLIDVVVMPALYIAVARLLAVRRVSWWLVLLWIAAMVWDTASLYPLRTLTGG
jgi:uncharacterized membrane protein YhaH (DUF805 family)